MVAGGGDVGADGEDDGEEELELFLCHGLEVHGIVVGLDAEAHAALEGPDPGGLCDLELIADAHARNGQILIRRGDSVRHGGGGGDESVSVSGSSVSCSVRSGRRVNNVWSSEATEN